MMEKIHLLFNLALIAIGIVATGLVSMYNELNHVELSWRCKEPTLFRLARQPNKIFLDGPPFRTLSA